MNTAERLVAAAVGVSHNAPYKHFASREALLAEVAITDSTALADSWTQIRMSPGKPAERLLSALDVLIRFSQDRPAHHH